MVKYFCAGGLLKEHPLVELDVKRQDNHSSGGVASSYGHLMVMLWFVREACAMENGKLGRRNKNRGRKPSGTTTKKESDSSRGKRRKKKAAELWGLAAWYIRDGVFDSINHLSCLCDSRKLTFLSVTIFTKPFLCPAISLFKYFSLAKRIIYKEFLWFTTNFRCKDTAFF